MGYVARFAWLLALAPACGDVTVSGDDRDAAPGGGADSGGGPATDAGLVDAGPPDAGPIPACVWTAPSSDPLVQVNTGGFEDFATLTFDGSFLFFTHETLTGPPADVFDAVRKSPIEPFGPSRELTELSSSEGEYDLEASVAGDEMFFLRDATDEILTAWRPDFGQPFGPTEGTGLTGYSPTLSGTGLHLYFIDLEGDRILRAARRTLDDPWGQPEDIGPLGPYSWIDISADERQMLLSGGLGEVSVAIATRATPFDAFDEPVPAGDVFIADGADILFFDKASWSGPGNQLIITAQRATGADDDTDLMLSSCFVPDGVPLVRRAPTAGE
jgi:hypothetical protein